MVMIHRLTCIGLFFGNPKQLGIQIAAVLMTIIHSCLVTAAILLVLKHTIGLALPDEHQSQGVDLVVHGQKSYSRGERGASSIQLEPITKKDSGESIGVTPAPEENTTT